jgi:hypothetical protein
MTPAPSARPPGPESHPAGCSCRHRKPSPASRRREQKAVNRLCVQLRTELIDRLDRAFAGGPLGDIIRTVSPDAAGRMMNEIQVALFPSAFDEPTHAAELVPPGLSTWGGATAVKSLITGRDQRIDADEHRRYLRRKVALMAVASWERGELSDAEVIVALSRVKRMVTTGP